MTIITLSSSILAENINNELEKLPPEQLVQQPVQLVDDFGFTAMDYGTERVNELNQDQLYAALNEGRITSLNNVDDSKLQDVVLAHHDLWEKETIFAEINQRIEKDVSFINDHEQFKSAWFERFDVLCTGCFINKFDAQRSIVSTVDGRKAAEGQKVQTLPAVVELSIADFQKAEILRDGRIRFQGGTVVSQAVLSLEKELGREIILMSPTSGSSAVIALGAEKEKYVYRVQGKGIVNARENIAFVGEDISVLSDENSEYTLSSASLSPVELSYSQKSKTNVRTVIPYAFSGEITFRNDDLSVLKEKASMSEKNALSDVQFSRISLGQKTKLYDFTTGNILEVEKPTEYYHRSLAVVTKSEEAFRCRKGSNCIEYFLDREKMGGVMRIEAADNNQIKVNVINLETRKDAKYKTFNEKLQKEIDQEMAYLSIGSISDGSKVIINDNSKVIIEFSSKYPLVKGRITDKTVSTIEAELPENIIASESVSEFAEENPNLPSQRKLKIDAVGKIFLCSQEVCSENGNVVSEKLDLTPAEISERVYVAAHRYALCSTATKKCDAYGNAAGFASASNPLEEIFGSKYARRKSQWATTCIGLTKAALPPELEQETKMIDRGFYVQDYLRRNVPGFATTYILVQEFPGYKTQEEEAVGEERVRQMVEQRIAAGEKVNLIVVPTNEERNNILKKISRGSLVTEPVEGHDYVYAGTDPATELPTTYEAHIEAGQYGGIGITRDIDGIDQKAILITYDEERSEINYDEIRAKGTVYGYNKETEKIEAQGIPERKDRRKAAEALKRKIAEEREFSSLLRQ